MNLEIEIISREVVTPSSPTPPHLKTYNLSFLDQIIPPVAIVAYFFFPANDKTFSNPEKSKRLKKSLSQALTLFYPLAGRLVGNTYIECNDEGVAYIEAQGKNRMLRDVITDPVAKELCQFLPSHHDRLDDERGRLVFVQATFFGCGGLALALEISHKVVDAFSYVMFLSTWSAFSRGDDEDRVVQPPKFESSILFPPKDLVGEIGVVEKKENIITKRFVFSSEKISRLQERYTILNTDNNEDIIRPTRIEALSSFIGSRFMAATRAKENDTKKVYVFRQFVDIRTRVVPPLSEYHFGNMIIPAIVTSIPSLEKSEGNSIAKKMRDAIRNINGDSVDSIRHRIESLFKNAAALGSVPTVKFDFTSFCSFPPHTRDFGWGIPIMIKGPNIPINNVAFFSNSFSGNGIDAWLNMKEEDMAKFEADEELLQYVLC